MHQHINKNHIMEVLAANYLDIHDIDSICVADTMVLCNYIEGLWCQQFVLDRLMKCLTFKFFFKPI
ncbi:hypothetical protein MTR_7g026640 [Medicago truncatula]|uniref:Uncharacterized protein n=1 Tax=Medicago truncatula TaxID=3880 RepID=G7L119_MEDTR|nr:hypothetical protein MTR_7g026640 [Medicago truncatula]